MGSEEGSGAAAQQKRPKRSLEQPGLAWLLFDACNLRLLGLRATIEVLKQPPVIAKQERAGEGD